jgi:hypothetical protein
MTAVRSARSDSKAAGCSDGHLQALLNGGVQLLVAAGEVQQLARIPLEGLVVAAQYYACGQSHCASHLCSAGPVCTMLLGCRYRVVSRPVAAAQYEIIAHCV